MSGQSSIPQGIITNSIASVAANKFSPISFTNYYWQVKDTGNGTWGPGPNYFAGTNVSVDSHGRLHLAITYANGEWRCAEVILTNSLGYGTYRIWLDNDPNPFPTNIVFGFFTFDYYTPPYYQEIDIEFSNGDGVGSPTNWQYVVQPYYIGGHRTNFSAPGSGMCISTHTLTWMPDAVYYESYTNHVADQRTFNVQSSTDLSGWATVGQTSVVANSTNVVSIPRPEDNQMFVRAVMASYAGAPAPFKTAWLTNGVPPAGGESIHLNLWLNRGGAPCSTTTNVYEVIISKFEFIPLASIEPSLQMTQVLTNQTDVSLMYRSN